MPIHIETESLCTLSEAARSLPRTPHISTLHRWRLKGIRGVRLDTCLIGGIRYTSREALQRFIEATTAAADHAAGSMHCEPLDARLRPYNRGQGHLLRGAAKILDDAGI